MADVQEQLQRIKEACEERLEWGDDRTMAPCMTEVEIEAFERHHKIRLPAEYRLYLLNVSGEIEYRDASDSPDAMTPWNTAENLDEPFPYAEERKAEYDQNGDRIEGADPAKGRLFLYDYGCGVYYHLIVNGPAYGQVWITDEANHVLAPYRINPARRGFLDWYEAYLTEFEDGDPDAG